jgi:signal transduction histidine kinase
LNVFALSGLLNFIVSIVLGFFVYVKDYKKAVNKSYLLYSLSIALWSYGYWQWLLAVDKASALFWIKFLTASAILIPSFYYHFVLVFLNLNGNKDKKKILNIAYFLSLFFLFISFSPLIVLDVVPKLSFRFWPSPGPFYWTYLIIFVGFVSYSIYLLIAAFRESTGYRRNQIKYVLLGSILGFGGGATNFPLWYDVPLYPYGNFAVLAFFVTFTFAIIRYRLIDISIVFKRTAVYSLSAGLLTGLFVVIVTIMTKYLSDITGVTSYAIMIVAALSIAVLFNPLKNRIQLFIDKVFYKKTFDYYATIRTVSHDLASMFDLQKIYEFIAGTIYETLGLDKIYLLTDAHDGTYEVTYYKSKKKKSKDAGDQIPHRERNKKFGKRAETTKFFRNDGDIIVKDELPRIADMFGQDSANKIKKELKIFSGEVVVPVNVDGELSMVMVLGEKMSGDMFSNEDINLLNTISNQTAISLKNAALYKDKVNTERMASIGMMSATFAHEIRNPLTSLKTFAQLMPEKYDDAEFREVFSKIVVKEIDRINGLIVNLLDFSTEKKSSFVDEIELTTFMDEIIEYTRGRLKIDHQNIIIEKLYNNDSIFVKGDAETLKQAFTNIINNGCQAMYGEGVLKITIKPNARNVEVAITDTGEGIDPDNLSKIFDPFVTTKEMGVGLGLAISKRTVVEHKGEISVESALTEGTTFTVMLPM